MLETEPKIVDAYVKTGRVKLVFRHILDYGQPSSLASQAAECAGDQKMFWAMHHLLFERQDMVWTASVNLYRAWAIQDLKIDGNVLSTCLSNGKYKSKVEGVYAAAHASGVRVRPTFDINGTRVQGAINFDAFKKLIDAMP